MARYFHVDRTNSLVAGQVLTLIRYSDIGPPIVRAHADWLLPEGVSPHGKRYLLRGDSGLLVLDSTLELVWELTRRQYQPDAPSRYQSVFAWESLTDAQRFQQQYLPDPERVGQAGPAGVIWEVEASLGFRADMNLLSNVGSALTASCYAQRYWEGSTHPDKEPWWEMLLMPPVKVINVAQTAG